MAKYLVRVFFHDITKSLGNNYLIWFYNLSVLLKSNLNN